MAASVSYRLPEDLKRRLAAQAEAEGITETRLVTRLLDEGVKTTAHPHIVYRDGPTGRRATLAAGPDVWEMIIAIRHAPGREEEKILDVADQLGLHENVVRAAVSFALAFPEEVEERIRANEEAAEKVRRMCEERERLLAG